MGGQCKGVKTRSPTIASLFATRVAGSPRKAIHYCHGTTGVRIYCCSCKKNPPYDLKTKLRCTPLSLFSRQQNETHASLTCSSRYSHPPSDTDVIGTMCTSYHARQISPQQWLSDKTTDSRAPYDIYVDNLSQESQFRLRASLPPSPFGGAYCTSKARQTCVKDTL